MAVTNVAAVAADLQTYFSKSLLKQYADLSVATTPLTEGTAPTDTALSTSAITATIDQLGAFVTLTDLAELTVKHPVTTKTTELLGVQAARSYDRTINSVVVAGTSVIYNTGNAARTDIGAGEVITILELRKAVALLRNNGAQEFDDGNFVLVVDPSVQMDLMADSVVQATVVQANGKNENYKGQVSQFMGLTIVRSNNIPTIASTTTVHTSYVFGQNAFAVSDLQNLTMYKEGPGSVSDPLHQKMTMGWKLGFKSVILNNNFMVRIETASAY
jgi:N4-gp56 family major capsid protein